MKKNCALNNDFIVAELRDQDFDFDFTTLHMNILFSISVKYQINLF